MVNSGVLVQKYHMLTFLSSVWMMAIGFRFLMMKPFASSISAWFLDWGILFFFGGALFLYSMYSYRRGRPQV